MAKSSDELLAFLTENRIAFETITHPAVFTVEEAKRLRGVIPGAHVKNLFLKDKKSALFLVSAVEDTDIDLKTLHQVIGGQGRLSFGSADQLRERLGVEPGSVTPFAVINDPHHHVNVVLDERLMAHARINVHPLVNTQTTGVSREGLFAFFKATGHGPKVLAIGGARADTGA
jgi:Ala-tRNA(Pro) deacylase